MTARPFPSGDGVAGGPLGILGGTFDPVHCGHLRLALEARDRLGLAEVRLMPAPNPRLRDRPRAAAADRAAMLALAVDGCPGLAVEAREIGREGPTRTVETLEDLRSEVGDRPLCLLLGMDSFSRLDEWERWTELADLAHLVVAHRPGAPLPGTGPVAALLRARAVDDPGRLAAAPAGYLHVCDVPFLDISASRVRGIAARGASLRFLVPDPVIDYIARHRLYAHTD